MKILSLDYGDKRIGLALGDTKAHVAVPYGILENRGLTYVLHQLKILIKKEDIGKLLIGLPFALRSEVKIKRPLNFYFSGKRCDDGVRVNAQMQKTLRFIDDVRDAIATPVVTIDERLSTREADNRTRSVPKNARAPRDAIAAAIILQNYLDRVIR